jgi:hypothetical protein
VLGIVTEVPAVPLVYGVSTSVTVVVEPLVKVVVWSYDVTVLVLSYTVVRLWMAPVESEVIVITVEVS